MKSGQGSVHATLLSVLNINESRQELRNESLKKNLNSRSLFIPAAMTTILKTSSNASIMFSFAPEASKTTRLRTLLQKLNS